MAFMSHIESSSATDFLFLFFIFRKISWICLHSIRNPICATYYRPGFKFCRFFSGHFRVFYQNFKHIQTQMYPYVHTRSRPHTQSGCGNIPFRLFVHFVDVFTTKGKSEQWSSKFMVKTRLKCRIRDGFHDRLRQGCFEWALVTECARWTGVMGRRSERRSVISLEITHSFSLRATLHHPWVSSPYPGSAPILKPQQTFSH